MSDQRPAPPEHTDRDALDLSHVSQRTKAESDYWVNQLKREVLHLRVLLARTPESASGTAEPVAWMICSIGGTREVTFDKARADEYVDCVAYSVEPLYLHAAPPPSVGATPSPEGETRNWIEDASHRNGKYLCCCFKCNQVFIGHKRRVLCKLCASSEVES